MVQNINFSIDILQVSAALLAKNSMGEQHKASAYKRIQESLAVTPRSSIIRGWILKRGNE